MKRFLLMTALAAAMSLPALADQTGGVSGRVTDLMGHPLANTAVSIYKLPVHEGSPAIKSATTDKQGYFTDITLEPGRYLVTANVMGWTSSCVIDDVFGGSVTRMKISVGADGQRCSGPRVHSAVVNPANTADVYIIR
jgi:protocatechuate 3,4-dioxygenase beta subunit